MDDLNLNTKDFTIIGIFIYVWGHYENYIRLKIASNQSLINKFNLEYPEKIRNHNLLKMNQIQISNFLFTNFSIENLEVFLKEELKNDLKYNRLLSFVKNNNIDKIRNEICHSPPIVSVIGAFQPGVGPQERRSKIVLKTLSFQEILKLTKKLYENLLLVYKPKHSINFKDLKTEDNF